MSGSGLQQLENDTLVERLRQFLKCFEMSQLASSSPGGLGPTLSGILKFYRIIDETEVIQKLFIYLPNEEKNCFCQMYSLYICLLGSWVISSEDRTKHEATFQSLNPASGFLTGRYMWFSSDNVFEPDAWSLHPPVICFQRDRI